MADFLPLPDKEYSVIYADPPWEYRQHGATAKSRGHAAKHYQTMTTDDISKLTGETARGGGGSLFHVGDFPKHRGGDQGSGGVGVRLQNRRFRVGQDLHQERAAVLGNGRLHPRKRGGV